MSPSVCMVSTSKTKLSYIQTVIGATRAKARTHFQRLNGTSKLVPFPFAEKSEFFRELFSH